MLAYLRTYRAYLAYFEARADLTGDDLMVGLGMAYSWIPGVVAMPEGGLPEAVVLLNAARERDLTVAELSVLRSAAGNSLVAASKLLHFVAPARFPIWDSRICRFLLGTTHQRLLQDPSVYLGYQALCREIIRSRGFHVLARRAASIAGHSVSPMRAAELLMFVARDK